MQLCQFITLVIFNEPQIFHIDVLVEDVPSLPRICDSQLNVTDCTMCQYQAYSLRRLEAFFILHVHILAIIILELSSRKTRWRDHIEKGIPQTTCTERETQLSQCLRQTKIADNLPVKCSCLRKSQACKKLPAKPILHTERF